MDPGAAVSASTMDNNQPDPSITPVITFSFPVHRRVIQDGEGSQGLAIFVSTEFLSGILQLMLDTVHYDPEARPGLLPLPSTHPSKVKRPCDEIAIRPHFAFTTPDSLSLLSEIEIPSLQLPLPLSTRIHFFPTWFQAFSFFKAHYNCNLKGYAPIDEPQLVHFWGGTPDGRFASPLPTHASNSPCSYASDDPAHAPSTVDPKTACSHPPSQDVPTSPDKARMHHQTSGGREAKAKKASVNRKRARRKKSLAEGISVPEFQHASSDDPFATAGLMPHPFFGFNGSTSYGDRTPSATQKSAISGAASVASPFVDLQCPAMEVDARDAEAARILVMLAAPRGMVE